MISFGFSSISVMLKKFFTSQPSIHLHDFITDIVLQS